MSFWTYEPLKRSVIWTDEYPVALREYSNPLLFSADRRCPLFVIFVDNNLIVELGGTMIGDLK